MRLHLLAIPHTVTRSDFSHCAYTGKVQRFSPMMQAQGFEVIHYGIEGSESGADEEVELLTRDEHLSLLRQRDYHHDPAREVGSDAIADSELYRQFNFYLRDELKARLEPGDIVCIPFSPQAYEAALDGLPLLVDGSAARLESGIGYPNPTSLARVYESEAWRHWVLGNESRTGAGWNTPRLEAVIPNYYDSADWLPTPILPAADRKRVVFLGRIGESKGCAIIPQLAAVYPELTFVLCGQGDPSPYLGMPNVEYHPPISGNERAAFLGHAGAAIFASRFVEPFCGAAVEAMLCGTPVLTSDFGAFTETVIDGVTGYRAGSFLDFARKLERVLSLERPACAANAHRRFTLPTCGAQYARVITQLSESLGAA